MERARDGKGMEGRKERKGRKMEKGDERGQWNLGGVSLGG